MDWSKAKNYLIIAFLLLDVLLGWQYWGVKAKEATFIQPFEEQLRDVKEVLDAHAVQLPADVQVPTNSTEMGFLLVHYDPADPLTVAKKELDDLKTKEVSPGVPVTTDTAAFLYNQPGIYEKQFLSPVVDLGSSKGVDHLFELLSSHVWKAGEYAEDGFNQIDGQQKAVRYLQMYKGYPLFSAPLVVRMDGDRVQSYKQFCVEVKGEEGAKRPVIPAVIALHSFADSLPAHSSREDAMKIENIELGYYSKQSGMTDNDWYMVPMWRILTNKAVYYVNGLTGEVQGEER